MFLSSIDQQHLGELSQYQCLMVSNRPCLMSYISKSARIFLILKRKTYGIE